LNWDGDLQLGPLNGTIWFLLKLMVFLYTYVWFRATLPRLRYDQLMNLGWKVLIPVSLGWFMLLAALQLGQDKDWNNWIVVGASAGVLLVCGLLLVAATTVSARNREREGAMF
jgi:NADH-quinone oxidoreductase subunit H